MDRGRAQDLVQAFICSEAVHLDKNEEVEKYMNKSRSDFPFDIQFEKVHVSVDQEDGGRGVKFLVAYTKDATFVAFREARNFDYLGQDSQNPPTLSALHTEVRKLAESFMGDDCKLLAELYRSEKRVIFCGHKLGGSVAQMVVIRFWTDNKIPSVKPGKNRDSMIAIAFGAPHIWDERSAGGIYGDLQAFFLNVVNEDDPLREILPNGLQGPGDDPRSIGIQLSSQSRGVSSAGSNCVPGKSRKPWSREKFRKNYKSSVDIVLKNAGYSRSTASADQPSSKILVDSPLPQVTSAIRKASDSGSFIIIRGSNLLFLREPVKLNGLYPWETRVQTDIELIIISSPDKTKAEDIKNVSTVVLKTAFGGTSYDVSEGGESQEKPLRLLSRIVQTFFFMATPGPFCCPPSEAVLDDLDGILQCVPDSFKADDEKSFSTLLRERAEDRGTIVEMNAVAHRVTEFLNSSYEMNYKVSKYVIMGCVVGGILLAAGLVTLPFGGIAVAAGGAAAIAVSLTAAGAAAAVGGGGVVAVSLSPRKLMLRSYTDMLRFAIFEASLWNRKPSDLAWKPSGPTASLAELELSLQQEVKRSGGELDRMMKLVNDPETKDIRFESRSNLKGATLATKQNFLRRVYPVAKTADLYNKEVKSIEFLGLVGEEDAGKSTFIKNAIERLGEKLDSGVPEVGIKYHTSKVTPYKLKGRFYLVDFPGGNGTEKYADAWRQFTSLPSSCVLLLDFKGDIKMDQVQMYQHMQKDMDSKIAVVFNKVDQEFSPRQEIVYNANYFENHRMKTAKLLACDGKDVHYACLDPDPVDRLTKLRKVGVLGFEELAFILGQWLAEHSDSESHRVLMDLSSK